MRSNRRYACQMAILAACVTLITFAEERGSTAQTPSTDLRLPGTSIRFGDPLPGLRAAQLEAFAAGLEEFSTIESPEEGLGPTFNGASCVQCHNGPAPGGGSPTLETRFGRMVNGQFDPMAEKGGSLLQQFAIDDAVLEHVPPEATIVAKRLSTPLFGAGLVEAIPDAQIINLARQPKPDGVTGRAAFILDVVSGQTHVGRFGWKAQHSNVLGFAADAYLNEMGITSRFFPAENAPNGNTALLAQYGGDIDASADFIRLLAPPQSLRQSASADAGQRLFAQIGCAVCHQPRMQTGPSADPAYDRKSVALYSDLLLHDMGSLGDGIAQGAARQREMRTSPLWGLRARMPFLHDGRATTIEQAIRAHDGEASVARERFKRLTRDQTQQLIDFLKTI